MGGGREGSPARRPPEASAAATASSGATPLAVRPSGSAVDPGDTIVSSGRELDRAFRGEGPAIVVTIGTVGIHEAILRILDDDGMEGTESAAIRVDIEIPGRGNVKDDLRIDISDPPALFPFLVMGGPIRPAGPSQTPPTRTSTAGRT